MGGSLESSDINDRGQSSRAVKAALDSLTERNTSEAMSEGSRRVKEN